MLDRDKLLVRRSAIQRRVRPRAIGEELTLGELGRDAGGDIHCVGTLADKQPRCVEFLFVVKKVAHGIRTVFDDEPFDRDARVNYQSQGGSVAVIAVFADEKLCGSLRASFGGAKQFGRPD